MLLIILTVAQKPSSLGRARDDNPHVHAGPRVVSIIYTPLASPAHHQESRFTPLSRSAAPGPSVRVRKGSTTGEMTL